MIKNHNKTVYIVVQLIIFYTRKGVVGVYACRLIRINDL